MLFTCFFYFWKFSRFLITEELPGQFSSYVNSVTVVELCNDQSMQNFKAWISYIIVIYWSTTLCFYKMINILADILLVWKDGCIVPLLQHLKLYGHRLIGNISSNIFFFYIVSQVSVLPHLDVWSWRIRV